MSRQFLVAPDSFKGTYSADDVALAIARGLEAAGVKADLCPAADGGEGTAAAIAAALDGSTVSCSTHDPIGRPIEANFVLLNAGEVAVIDTAAASGLPLLAAEERNAELASSYGTGEIISAAIDAGARKVLLAAGGSATTDGGSGAIKAIRASGGLRGASLHVLCDVTTPFEQSARVFGPQKGANSDAVKRLTHRLVQLATQFPHDPRGIPMTGCAGGLSGGLWAAFDAQLEPGADYILRLLDFERRLGTADAIVSGEGKLDAQSFEGKLLGQIAAICARRGKPLHLLVGRNDFPPNRVTDPVIRSVREASSLEEIAAAAGEIAHGW